MRITLLIAAMTLVISILCGTVKSQAQDCESLASQGNNLIVQSENSRSTALAAANALRSSSESFQSLITQYNNADAAGRSKLESAVMQRHATHQANWSQYINGLNVATQDIAQLCAFMEEFMAAGCGDPNIAACRESLQYHRNQQAQDNPIFAAETSKTWQDYVSKQPTAEQTQQTATPPETKNPTVRIVNSAGMPICVHPAGLSGGACFPAGKSRVYKLKDLRGWDTDTGQRLPTKQLVIVGGGVWTGSPYTSYQDMTLCTKRTFDHDAGEVEWIVRPGLEEDCSVRGYHQ